MSVTATGADDPPPLPARWLPRPRVRAALEAASGVPITVVEGPAGYGKSTAVADWLASSAHAVVWVSCGRRESGRVGAPALGGAVAGAARPPVLVLDDLDDLDDEQALRDVRAVLAGLPTGSRAVLIARRIPGRLQVGRWKWRGVLHEIGVGTLAFTSAETASYLRDVWHLDVDGAQAERVRHDTGGWPAALWLVAAGASELGRSPHEVLGHDRSLARQFTDAVLSGESREDIEVLRRCAALDVCAPEVCADVLGDPGTLARLWRLSLHGLLVEAPDRALRPRPPLGVMLQQDFADRHPEELRGLQERSVRSLAAHGQAAVAVERALLDGRASLAGDILDGHAEDILALDGGVTLRRLAQRLPGGEVGSFPALASVLVDLAALSRDIGTVRSLLAALVESGSSQEVADHAVTTAARLTGAGGESLLRQPESEDTAGRAHLRATEAAWAGYHGRARALLHAVVRGLRRADRLRRLVVLTDLAWERASAGDAGVAERVAGAATALARALGFAHRPVYLDLVAVSVAADRGHRGEAERDLRALEERTRATVDPVFALDLLMERVRVDNRAGVVERALGQLPRLGGARRSGADATARRAANAMAVLRLRVGDVAGAAAAAPHVVTAHDHGMLGPADRVLLAGLLLGRGSAARAGVVAATVGADVCGPRLAAQASRIGLLAAEAASGTPGPVAVPRPSGPPVRVPPTPVERPADPPGAAPAPGLLDGAPAPASRRVVRTSSYPRMLEALTPRECEVLGLLPFHMPYKDIAGELQVSMNTLKSHLKSVYRKLGASSRWAAVARGYELGLLADRVSGGQAQPPQERTA
jgi:LuxR family maltose regulon positive regulatory protein